MFLGAFGFLYMGIVGGCSQPVPDLCYQIEVDKPLQTMDYFGASDAWSMQFIGLWPQEKQNQIADWLFSMENDEMVNRKGLVCLSGVSTLEQVVRNKVKQARLLHLGCVPNVFCKRTERTTGISNRDSVTS